MKISARNDLIEYSILDIESEWIFCKLVVEHHYLHHKIALERIDHLPMLKLYFCRSIKLKSQRIFNCIIKLMMYIENE